MKNCQCSLTIFRGSKFDLDEILHFLRAELDQNQVTEPKKLQKMAIFGTLKRSKMISRII